jgi:hypothetical protein
MVATFEQRASVAEAEVAELRNGLQGSRAQQEEEVCCPVFCEALTRIF